MLTAYLNIFTIFLLVLIGYILTWQKWFDNLVADAFSKLILNISLPLNMFLNITQEFTRSEFLALFKGMLLPFASILTTFFISFLYVKFSKVKKGRQGSFQTMFTASNTIFLGLPINLAIFGEQAVPYVLLYYICNTTFFWVIGVVLIAMDSPEIEHQQIHFDPLTALKRILSPALLGFLIGLIWVMLNLPSITIINSLCKYLGGLTTPLSMFVIGTIIYQTGLKNLHFDKDIFGVLLGRYLISPLIVLALSFIIPVPKMMLSVFIVQSAMPIQNSVPILARAYKGDTQFAATSLTYSILLYLLVIPVLLWFIL